ncbi:hypothetical protein A4A49_43301 [Nicotiana attenuata]|uniref:Uncharacterized protein n=1 Tax=Nicotiana attenuata TaxID=49451 RepID=A0A1J6JM73_NICAT|nr:hypothetical protein A4A49_43301 [Nicotiana attenuata]
MVVDVDSELNDAGNADIEKGMQPGESTAEDKREELLEAGRKEFGEILKQYEKGEIHIFTPVESQTGSVGMKTLSVSQHLDQISSDASELLPKPKRRKISSSPMCDTSDISNFNICSFSLGSTQGADSEGNSAAVGVREETEERREQQGIDQASATMAVVPHRAAVQHHLVVTEQQEEQSKGKEDKKGKRMRMESIWLRSPYVVYRKKPRGQDCIVGKNRRRCPFYYVSQDNGLIQRFKKWLKMDASEYDSNPLRLTGLHIQKSFFTELMDPDSDLADEVSY